VDGDHARILTEGKSFLLRSLQVLLGDLVTSVARLKMRTVDDIGTEIGAREALFKQVIPPGGIGAELGVFKGTLSAFILFVNHPATLRLIDPWFAKEGQWWWAQGDRSTVRALATLLLALREPIESGQVRVHLGGSVEVLSTFPDRYLDWAYVDSTHAYEQTRGELESLRSKVKPTGIIAGDDWQDDETHPHHGVCKAVTEFLAERPEYELIFKESRNWALKLRAPGP
jgi:Methyltransferase domain